MGRFTSVMEPIAYDITQEFTGDPSTSHLILYLEVRPTYRITSISASSWGYYPTKVTAGCFLGGGLGEYYPFGVSHITYIPVCSIKLQGQSRDLSIQSITQLQYGPINIPTKNTCIFYEKLETTGVLHHVAVENYSGGNSTLTHSIDIPFGTGGGVLSVYHNPTQFSEESGLTLTGPAGTNDPVVLIAQIRTDSNGDIGALYDWTNYSPYNRGWLENTVITDVHNGLP